MSFNLRNRSLLTVQDDTPLTVQDDTPREGSATSKTDHAGVLRDIAIEVVAHLDLEVLGREVVQQPRL